MTDIITKESLLLKIEHLYQLYEKNQHVLQKLDNYVSNTLPCLLSNIVYQQNQKLVIKKNDEQFIESFYRNFIQKYLIYYIPTFETFFILQATKFERLDEDDLYHLILQTLSHESSSISSTLKHKTKHFIIKKCKETSIETFIPESNMIQDVLNIFIPFFISKNMTKYFFTIIGDQILKKNTSSIYFLPNYTKKFIREISQSSIYYFHNDFISSLFKFKYHDSFHLNDIRLISFHSNSFSNVDYFHHQCKDLFFSFIFVCLHYSQRYKSSDEYILSKSYDILLYNHAFTFKQQTLQKLIQNFVIETFDFVKQSTLSSLSISFKNIHFFWKQYLEEKNIPLLLYQNELKTSIKEIIGYDEINDSFLGITSKKLCYVNRFIQFWEETITEDIHIDYDIDEFVSLYQQWNQKGKNQMPLCENQMIELILHFYPNIVIENNKHILGISCSLWNKKQCISEFIQYYLTNENSLDKQTMIELYTQYCEYSKIVKKLIVNKDTFEKEIKNEYQKYVINGLFRK